MCDFIYYYINQCILRVLLFIIVLSDVFHKYIIYYFVLC